MEVGLITLVQEQNHPAPSGHPENSLRLKKALEYVEKSDIARKVINFIPGEVDASCILGIHTREYIDEVKATSAEGGGYLDGDTYVRPGTFKAAWETASAAIGAADAIMRGKFGRVFLAGRPPGHHAEKHHGMGFCVINNIAVAAESLVVNHRLKRIAIVDWDVHHGNGTQHSFYERSDVFFVSLHRYPFYPGSGAGAERGSGNGEGYTLNVPLPVRTGAERYLEEFHNKVIPALEKYRPEFILISCGFDAHFDDPLGGMEMTEEAFGDMTGQLVALSDKYCEGRILSVFEGGYDPVSNGLCLYNHLKELQAGK